MFQGFKKRVVGYVIDICSRCGDKQPLTKFKNEWFCNSCLKVYKRSLQAPHDVEDSERQRERFNELVNH